MFVYADNAATTKISNEALDGFPPHKIHCSVLAEEAVAAPCVIIMTVIIFLMTNHSFPTASIVKAVHKVRRRNKVKKCLPC